MGVGGAVPGPPGFCWWVLSSVLDQALGGANFDRQKTLRRMADEGVLLPGSGRGFTRQKRFGDSRVYCVCVDNAALEAMLERSAGAPPAGGAVSRGRAMLRHGSETPLAAGEGARPPPSRLKRLDGDETWGDVARGRARARARAGGTSGPISVETLRRAAFALVAGLLSVLPGGETAAGGHVRRGGRCAR